MPDTKTYQLEKQQELRLEIDFGKTGTLKLLQGTAEIFGTEMALEKVYSITGTKIAIFSWHGATIQTTGEFLVGYVSKETPMVLYLNTHAAIEQLRLSAEAQNIMGPRILIAGATDVGKSTMCKILLNYAARSGRKPLYVDLDVGQSGISLSGAAGAVLIEKPIDIEEGLSSHIPLLYHYGHIQPGENVSLYKSIMTRLASAIHKKMEKDPHSKHSGVIVNSCGWIEGLGFEFLLHAVQAFQIDVVIALDSEKLYYDLKTAIDTKLTSNNDVAIISLPKSGGVVSRNNVFRRRTRTEKIKHYLYGFKNDLSPNRMTLKFNDYVFIKLGAPSVPASCLPVGEVPQNNELKVITVAPSLDLLYSVLSISALPKVPDNLQTLVDVNIIGFAFISNINMEAREFTILSPSPGRLPSNLLIVSTFKTDTTL